MLGKLYLRVFRSLTLRGILHYLAMNSPHDFFTIPLYRLRGTKIGKNVGIAQGTFIEESVPELVTIGDGVNIGPKVTIVAHDSSWHTIAKSIPIVKNAVVIKKNAYIGAGVIILPGVTIGEYSVVGAGSVVSRDVPDRSIVRGVPARVVGTVDEKIKTLKK